MEDTSKNLLDVLAELGQEQQKEQALYEAKNDASQTKELTDTFYMMCLGSMGLCICAVWTAVI